jgi:hypothetical protein
MKLTQNQTVWLRRMQEEWMSIMEPFSLEGGKAFTPIPKLGREHLANARLVPSREDLLEEFPRGGIGGEVGTQHGYFAKKLYEVVQPRELHLFDLSFDKMESTWPLVDEERKRIFMHVGDSAPSLAQFPEGYFDWLYIDADHSYEGVSRDIAEAVRVVKGSGFLAFNDFTYWSPVEMMPYGVAHAVCDLCINGD